MTDNWDDESPGKQIEKLRKIIQRITISRHQICIDYSKCALTGLLLKRAGIPDDQTGTDTDNYRVNVPTSLKRCGLETRLIIPGSSSGLSAWSAASATAAGNRKASPVP